MVAALEMHGTGTGLGDPIEVGAAFAVYQTANGSIGPLELQVMLHMNVISYVQADQLVELASNTLEGITLAQQAPPIDERGD